MMTRTRNSISTNIARNIVTSIGVRITTNSLVDVALLDVSWGGVALVVSG